MGSSSETTNDTNYTNNINQNTDSTMVHNEEHDKEYNINSHEVNYDKGAHYNGNRYDLSNSKNDGH